MSISDKTRKILWGRSGNRCVICKRELVIDSTSQDDESVVGEECHIVSSRGNGPRYDPSYPGEKIEMYENIVLLCRVDHKMADDQVETFTADILRQMKANHEIWVTKKLADRPAPPKPLRIRRVEERTPDFLYRLTSGKQVLELASSCYAYSMDQDELRSQSEVNLVAGFLQIISEWGDLIDDLEPSDRVSITYNLTQSLQDLEDAGFFVFGGREIQVMEGGIQEEPTDWPVAIFRVLRQGNKEIIKKNLYAPDNGDTQLEDSSSEQ